MLRVSATVTETEVDLQGIAGDAAAAATGLPLGAELMAFASALVERDEAHLARTREALLKVGGDRVLVDAAGVAANFQRMVRIADSCGIPVDNLDSEVGQSVRQELGLAAFPGAANSGL